jgi:ABC-type antimicrobial peptide transport system permease subunit
MAVADVSPAIGIEFRVFSVQIRESLLRERLMATLSGGFSLLAGLLATLGLYGVIAYMIARRRNEIGLRVALGADRARVIRLVLREAAVLVAVGLAAGALIAVWAGRAAASLLFGLQPHDPVTMAAAMALLAAVALLASYVPARRAAALEPMAALREE